jgi:hypothetical protein
MCTVCSNCLVSQATHGAHSELGAGHKHHKEAPPIVSLVALPKNGLRLDIVTGVIAPVLRKRWPAH